MNSLFSNFLIKNSFIFSPKIHRIIIESMKRRRGLVVMYLSKAYSVPKHISDNFNETTVETTSGDTNPLVTIDRCQRELSDITDMIHVSQVIHKKIIDFKDNQTIERKDEIHSSNTISILIGDLLLAQSSRGLALIRNPTITGLIAEAIGNFSEAEFFRLELNGQQKKTCEQDLEKYCYLSGGSLLAHSCKSALLLAKFDQQIQNQAFLIGKHIGIAFRLSDLISRQSTPRQSTDDSAEEFETFDKSLLQLLLESNIEKAMNLIKCLNPSEATKSLTELLLVTQQIESNEQIL